MIPASSDWHEHHTRAAREVNRRLGDGETMVVAAPALVESYSVLTRLPAPHRLSPSVAWALLDANFLNDGREIIALPGAEYRRLLQTASEQGIAGGPIYDAVIMACALAGGVDAILTFNARHFLRFRAPGIAIVVPA